jgi:2-phosphosulfolactate phosphatase
MEPIRVHLSPLLVAPTALAGGFVLVIDLLRASTTIVHALASGAAGVLPCEEINEAKVRAAAIPGTLLGGERSGIRIEGFDLGNSPAEYTPQRVAGQTIVFTTTNGTRAIRRASQAHTVAVACLANLSACVAAALEAHGRGQTVHLLCAGVRGEVSLDDAIAAGALAQAISVRGGQPLTDDPSILAVHAWTLAGAHPAGMAAALAETRGGRNLLEVGLGPDIAVCARIDTTPVLPALNASTGLVTAR